MSTDKKKKRSYASNAVLYAAFVIGAIVAINLLSTRVFGRLDLTENKVYTLSQPSKDLVKNLPDFLNVTAFISSDLPAQLKTTSRYVRDLIDEYKTNSNGKFNWGWVGNNTDFYMNGGFLWAPDLLLVGIYVYSRSQSVRSAGAAPAATLRPSVIAPRPAAPAPGPGSGTRRRWRTRRSARVPGR
mgnify:CR=1 FL=1